jgi:protein-disulfide isomerase
MKLTQILMAGAIACSMAFATTAIADDTFSAAQKTQIEGIVHDYLLKNPDVIIQAVQSLQQKQMDQMRNKGAEAALKNANALFASALDPVAGNPQGKVSVVEFFDYQCPHCVDMDPVFAALIKSNPDVRVVYKDFPIRGAISMTAAKAALAAGKQGKYPEMHEALMKNAKDLTDAKIQELAKAAGLDMKTFKADMDGDAVKQQITGTYKLAQDIGIMGTPAIFIAKTTLPKDANPAMIDFIPGQVDLKYLQDGVAKANKS